MSAALHVDAGGASPDDAGARIVADVGGTRARFATVGATWRDLEGVEVQESAAYRTPEEALQAYLRHHPVARVAKICFAVAGPVTREGVELPNSPWSFDRRRLESTLGAPLVLINDFTAQALALDLLRPDELHWLGTPRPGAAGTRIVIGPGTGLGSAIQAPRGDVLPSEAGHMGFAPVGAHQLALLQTLLARFPRVSVERLVSGPGLENVYWANARIAEDEAALGSAPAPAIAALAADGDALALRSVRDVLDILAGFAGDMALSTWAVGGVYLSGGVLGKLMAFFDADRFRDHFEDKGRFRGFCESVPVAWIRAEHPGLLGCSAALAARARGGHLAGGAASPLTRGSEA